MSQVETYFIPPGEVSAVSDVIDLAGDEGNHLVAVRRAKAGDELYLIDGEGKAYKGSVLDTVKKKARIRIIEEIDGWNSPTALIALGLGILKADSFLTAIDSAVQLGVSSIVPLKTDYTIAKWSDTRMNRGKNRIKASAKQCCRAEFPKLENQHLIEQWCIECKTFPVKILFSQDGRQAMPESLDKHTEIAVAIGPEGGFSTSEKEVFRDYGFYEYKLGRTRLRSETAVASALAVIQALIQENN